VFLYFIVSERVSRQKKNIYKFIDFCVVVCFLIIPQGYLFTIFKAHIGSHVQSHDEV
jgi:hypothetical protein